MISEIPDRQGVMGFATGSIEDVHGVVSSSRPQRRPSLTGISLVAHSYQNVTPIPRGRMRNVEAAILP